MIETIPLQVTPDQGEAIVIATVVLAVVAGAGRAGSNVGWLAFGIIITVTMTRLIGLIDLSVLYMIYAVAGVVVALTNVLTNQYG